ncbi:MAG: hypothetical protein PHI98_14700 [Eubacteriales bacterium]|nr:hypothetical protein [Eubacteriales bacterium]
MKKLLCTALAAALLLCGLPAANASETSMDYTVAEKLEKQIQAGSGFSGTMQLEISAPEGTQTLTTLKPLNVQWDYIYVRPNGTVEEEQRVDLGLMDGETALTNAHIQLKSGAVSVQADLLGDQWYRLVPSELSSGTAEQASDSSVAGWISATLGTALAQTGVPALLEAMIPALLSGGDQSVDLSALMDTYLTRMDLWIVGYRQSTEIGKLEDGTATMELGYSISPANIKAQLKQMLLDLLADENAIAQLNSYFGETNASALFNPQLQPYYFAAIDQLPLAEDLTIVRTVSLKGDTLALHLALPFYDAKGGSSTLRYDRLRGEGDLPDDNTITLETEKQVLKLAYLEYSSMTDVTVLQGVFSSEPNDGTFVVSDEQANDPQTEKSLAVAFTLRQQNDSGKDDEGRDTYRCQYQLNVSPDPDRDQTQIVAFEDMDIALDLLFSSQTLKTASTEMDMKLTLSGEKRLQTIVLTANGKTRKQWTPTEIPAQQQEIAAMTTAEVNALLSASALKASALLLPYFDLGAAVAEATAEPTQEATVFPVTTIDNGESGNE